MSTPSFKIILCSEVPEAKRDFPYVFSIECGLHDGQRHFDHHKPEHRANPSPANNPHIVWYWDGKFEQDAEIYITHVDADTFIGLSRLIEGCWSKKEISHLDFSLIEKIDLNGSSAIDGPLENCREYLFALGLSENAKILFPRCTKEPIDVTAQFKRFAWYGEYSINSLRSNIIEMDDLLRDGRAALTRSEKTYVECRYDFSEGFEPFPYAVGFWAIGANDPFDPSRPYRGGCDVVVVYRSHYKTISIYANPKLSHVFNSEWAGIQFAGHPKACGSPRGTEYTQHDGWRVWKAIVEARQPKNG